MRSRQPRLAVDPLLRKYGTVAALARASGCPRSSFTRWQREGGIPLFTADRIAIRLRLHPVEVWPEWYQIDGAGTADEAA